MAKRFKLRELAEANGMTEEWYIGRVVAPIVNSKGQAGAAHDLGVSQATISEWLKKYNYKWRPDWVKKMTPEDAASIQRAVTRHHAWEQEQEQAPKYRTIKFEGEPS